MGAIVPGEETFVSVEYEQIANIITSLTNLKTEVEASKKKLEETSTAVGSVVDEISSMCTSLDNTNDAFLSLIDVALESVRGARDAFIQREAELSGEG